jgi:Tol biopolymer transport system component
MLLLLLALPASPAGVVKIEWVSPPPLDLEVPLASSSPVLSADGRFVAFVSGVGEREEVYVRDRQTGATERVSINSTGAAANGDSRGPAISGDGRFVAFQSLASNLAPGDTGRGEEIYVRNRVTGKTERVSVTADGEPVGGGSAAISADGRFVAFTNGGVYVRDLQKGTTELASVSTSGAPANSWSFSPAVSGDGRLVAFESDDTNLVPGDTNDRWDVFVRDRQTGTTERVSVGNSGAPVDEWSGRPTISSDGRFVAFESDATNLVPGVAGATRRVYLRDRLTGKTEPVSVTADGAAAGGGSATISADGRFIAFGSDASNMVSGDTNDTDGIFIRDRQTGKTELVSIRTDQVPSGGSSPSISSDGRFVAFSVSEAPGSDATRRAVVFDRVAATTEPLVVSGNVSRTPLNSGQPAISGDGQWVAFVTAGQVFARHRVTGAAQLVSASAEGAPANHDCFSPAISGDGRFIAFWSSATNLVPGDTNGRRDIFVRDRQTGKTELVSVAADGAPGNADSYSPALSADGRFVSFVSEANNLVPGDTNGRDDLFVRDRQSGKTELVSVTPSGAPAGGQGRAISADGRFVAFASWANNLVPGDTNESNDIFVRDRQSGTTELVSVTVSSAPANNHSSIPAISADGRFVAFISWADNLVPGDTNGTYDVFVRDRQMGKTELVSIGISGVPANNWSGPPAISADGRFVAFQSLARNLVPENVGGGLYVYVRDRQSGKTELVSVTASGAPTDSRDPVISGDGRFVAFESGANNLVPGDTNGRVDVFVAERG